MKERVCIVGAGSTGITIAKALQDKNIPFICYEKGSYIGGNWKFQNDNGFSNIYRSLHTNTYKKRMEFKDFPMPEDYPDYPSHELVYQYFENYTIHFGIKKYISFRTEVVSVTPVLQENSILWEVEIKNKNRLQKKIFEYVIIANGHHSYERYPDPPYEGTDHFKGEIIHSHKYIDPENPVDCYGKNILIVGLGNSAVDIACELSNKNIAKKVIVTSRRSAWIIPKYLLGIPIDFLPSLVHPLTPIFLQRFFVKIAYRLTVGKITNYGLPQPDHSIGDAHPTISQEFLGKLGHGDIIYKQGLERFHHNYAYFKDGTKEKIDVVIFCTGYDLKFPFFNEQLQKELNIEGNYIPLYFRMFPVHKNLKNLLFGGLVQPLGAIMPIAELQGKWMALYITGEYQLPDEKEMLRWIQKYKKKVLGRFVNSPRHTMEVDFDSFIYSMKKEIQKGIQRTKK